MKDEQDDIILDDETGIDDSVVAEESQKETIKKLREKLAEAIKEKQEYLTNWQKAQADFMNMRKRDEQEKKDYAKFAAEAVVMDVIPVLDTFALATKNKEVWEALPKDWRIGMESIINQLDKVLQTHGLIQYGKVGEQFDPTKYEAIEMKKAEAEKEDNTIAEVLQPGYALHDRVIRPAKVSVYSKNND